MLALLIHDVTNPHNFALIRGAEAQARAAGYTLVLCHTEQSAELEATQAERLRSTVDGLMLAASRLSDEQLAGLARRTPTVLFNRQLAGFAGVVHGLRRRRPADRRTPGTRSAIGASPTSRVRAPPG